MGERLLNVRLERETVWPSLQQLGDVFGRDKSVISRHLKNIFDSKELDRDSVVAKNATTAAYGKVYLVDCYNLDVVISVGYRVDSVRATRFRQWATGVLRDHLVQGYSVNAARLRDLRQAVRLVADTAQRHALAGDEAQALLAIVGDYTRALGLLDDYDHRRADKPKPSGPARYSLQPVDARRIVAQLRVRFGSSAVFGVEKDRGVGKRPGRDRADLRRRGALPGPGGKGRASAGLRGSRTMRSSTATSGSLPSCSCGTSNETALC